MEFTDSYGYRPDLLWPYRRLNNEDLGRLLLRRVQQERDSLVLLSESLDVLRKRGDKDPFSFIDIKNSGEVQKGWIISRQRSPAPGAGPRDIVTVAMSEEGEIWQGRFDVSSHTLEVDCAYPPQSVPYLEWLYRANEGQIVTPLVSEQENEVVAGLLQRPDSGLAISMEYLIHPRSGF
ncbi:MAG TPA: hypothetical protein VHD60_00285 [Candidatus Saccharimonadales bacterium]|nr:hypothetical protein [Candidatus Saccharimonadales bacterium]